MPAFSPVTYRGDGVTTDFFVPWPYLSTSNISVTVNGSPATIASWVTPEQLRLSVAPADGTAVKISDSYVTADGASSTVTFAADSEAAATDETSTAGLLGVLRGLWRDAKARWGALTEAAPASDTASSGLNGRLQRIAQNVTSLIARLPTALGSQLSAASLSTVTASDDPILTAIGATADAASNTTGSLNAHMRYVASKIDGISPAAAGTSTPANQVRIKAAASTNATSVKSSGGRIFSMELHNGAAYDVFLKLYQKATAPTVGTDVPVHTVRVKAASDYVAIFPWGYPMPTGFAYAITKLYADTDTTVVVADDLYGTISYN
jgi:hypothetical protein